MKKLRIVLLSAAVIMIGAGAAFATRAAGNSGNTEFKNPQTGVCRNVEQWCSESGTEICTWTEGTTTHNLYLRGTNCSVPMFWPSN
jgi:Family of unknown function (DUF6520)